MFEEKCIAYIESVIVEVDPEGLIKLGCPLDEYLSEAKMIFEKIKNLSFDFKNDDTDHTMQKEVLSQIFKAVKYVFKEQFGIVSGSDGIKKEDTGYKPSELALGTIAYRVFKYLISENE